MPTVRIVGPGRAGTSLADALASIGWTIAAPVSRHDDPRFAAAEVDLCVLSVPDALIAPVAARIEPVATTVVAHLAGSLGAELLTPHQRRAAMHPLVSLPDRLGSRLVGAWWAVSGDPLAVDVVAALGGRVVNVPDRAGYHAAACIAANHLVALMAQVERVASGAGLPAEPFYELASATLANARRSGARAALTGPASRGDVATIERHLASLDPGEHDLYLALASAAAHLGGKDLDVGLSRAGH